MAGLDPGFCLRTLSEKLRNRARAGDTHCIFRRQCLALRTGRRTRRRHAWRDGLRAAASQRIRKRIEEAFGWMKIVAGQRKTKFRGVEQAGWSFAFAAAAYNLIRLPKLIEARAA